MLAPSFSRAVRPTGSPVPPCTSCLRSAAISARSPTAPCSSAPAARSRTDRLVCFARSGASNSPFAKKSAAPAEPEGTAACSCGSRQPYQDCCRPYHRGAWARTAVEVAMARLSARLLDLPEFIANTTHPESLDLIGGRRKILRDAGRVNKGYQRASVRLAGLCHGPGTALPTSRLKSLEKEGQLDDSWLIIVVVNYVRQDQDPDEPPQELGKSVSVERYVKHQGQWMYACDEEEIPASEPFREFCDRWLGDEDSGPGGDSGSGADDAAADFNEAWRAKAGARRDGTAWPYGFELVQPSYAPASLASLRGVHVGPASATAEDELLGPWLWDELAEGDGEPAVQQPGQPARPRRRGLVYLDDYAPLSTKQSQQAQQQMSLEHQQLLFELTGVEGEGLSVRRAAILNDRLQRQRSSLRDPAFSVETYLFRVGRYRTSNH